MANNGNRKVLKSNHVSHGKWRFFEQGKRLRLVTGGSNRKTLIVNAMPQRVSVVTSVSDSLLVLLSPQFLEHPFDEPAVEELVVRDRLFHKAHFQKKIHGILIGPL